MNRYLTSPRRGLAWLVAASVGLFAPAAVAAQDPEPIFAETMISTEAAMEVTESGLEAADAGLELTVEQAVAIALQRNLGLLVQRYDREQFSLELDANRGIYDVNLTSFLYANEETSPSADELAGAAVLVREQQDFNLDVSQLFPTGGTARLTYNIFRQEDNNAFNIFNPFWFNDLDFIVSQPLLRNLGREVTERGIVIARLNSAISRETFERQVIDTVQAVINAYFTLVEARESLVVSRESLALAEELHSMNKVRVEVGTLAPLELVQSEAGIATRQEEIIRARFAVEDAEDDLRTLLNLEDGPLWEVRIVTTAPEDIRRVEVDLDRSIATALDRRSELTAKDLEIQLLEVESAFRQNQKLPRLDLSARYGYNGIGGDTLSDPNDPNSPVISGGLGDAWDQVTRGDFDGWQIRFDFAYPIQNRDAKARALIADLDLEQGQVELAQLQQQIRTEVRKAVRAVETAAQAYDSALVSRRLEERNLEAERKRYENGLSTSYQVLEITEDLTNAKRRVVAAVAVYRRAVADYYRVVGQLLDRSNVTIADPTAEDESAKTFWF